MDLFPVDPQCQWEMPPLVLHPFSESSATGRLIDGARASLILDGFLPNNAFSVEDLRKQLLAGRFDELRMLYYIGKDLFRWIEQCVEIAQRDATLWQAGVRAPSFAVMLVDDPPELVRRKLQQWGVVDHKSIFSRALGFNAVFSEAPALNSFKEEFILDHAIYADRLFHCWLEMAPFTRIRGESFPFKIFASGEYIQLFEQ